MRIKPKTKTRIDFALRWEKVFGKEYRESKEERGEQLHMNFEVHDGSTLPHFAHQYYDKKMIENLKATSPFMSAAMLPKTEASVPEIPEAGWSPAHVPVNSVNSVKQGVPPIHFELFTYKTLGNFPHNP